MPVRMRRYQEYRGKISTILPFSGCSLIREVWVKAHWRKTIMDIHLSGSRPSRRGPADSFTGTVWQDPIIETPAPARIRSGMVRFEPGARTHWHTHPLGQTLAVISG